VGINDKGQIICHGINFIGSAGYFAYYLLTLKPSPDLNEDNIVDFRDLAELAAHWLEER
jgi:hypothetical protein